MNHTIIGAKGQIGSCVSKFFKSHGDEVCEIDITSNDSVEPEFTEILHICIRYSDETFISTVKEYISKFNPRHIIVYSTVAPGTTELLGHNAVHSPVEGRHPDLYEGFTTFDRFVSGPDSVTIGKMFSLYGMNVKTFLDSKTTELGKILSTTRYGVNIMFSRVQDDLCKQFGLDYESVVTDYQRMYNSGYKKLNEDRFVQPLLTPPDKNGIGGHCVLENSILLDEIKPNELLKQVISVGKHPNSCSDDKPYLNRAWLYCEYWGKGRTVESIGKECGCTETNILRIMKRLNILRRTNKWNDLDIESFKNLSKIHTFKEISEILGKSHDSIRTKAIQLDIQSIYEPAIRDESTRKKISATLQGVTLEEWEGFRRNAEEIIRKSEKYQEWRKSVFNRDNYTCQECKIHGGSLHAHHIKSFSKYQELRFDLNNGLTLCVDCHKKTDSWGQPSKNHD